MDRLDKISIMGKLWDRISWVIYLLTMLCVVFVFLLGVYWAVSGFWGPGIITFLLLFYYLCTRDKL